MDWLDLVEWGFPIFGFFVLVYFFTGYQKKVRKSYEEFAAKNDFLCDVGAAPKRRINKILNGSSYFSSDSEGNIDGYGDLFIWGESGGYRFSTFLFTAIGRGGVAHKETVICVSIPDGDFPKFSINRKRVKFSRERKNALLGDREKIFLSSANIVGYISITVEKNSKQEIKIPMRFLNKYAEFKDFDVEVLNNRLLLYRVNTSLIGCPEKIIEWIGVATQLADALSRWAI